MHAAQTKKTTEDYDHPSRTEDIPDKMATADPDCTELSDDITAPGKRANYLSWDEYFMSTAFLSSLRSKDPATRVGACIVNSQSRIVGIGYNGMPRGCPDNKMPWGKSSTNELHNKYLYVCHAEMNAILNKNAAHVENCTIYSTLFPCNECAKMIIQSGIKEVVYYSDKHGEKPATIASKRMFELAEVAIRQFRPKTDRLIIDFTDVDKINV